MQTIRRNIPKTFNIPRRISRLGELAYNMWWSWNPKASRLFFEIDNPLWDRIHHNPVAFLEKADRTRLNAAVNDPNYLRLYDDQMAQFDAYLGSKETWFHRTYPEYIDHEIAYFSFEFGLAECIPVYAGGMGILAGDHLKEASDLGIPIVGLGFIYRQGYFTQKITEDGWQETRNYILNFEEMPIIPVMNDQNKPLKITVELPGRMVTAKIWVVRVGRVPLYLLDTDVDENTANDRQLNARLYSADPETRISQEMILGIGGVRALRAMGYQPTAWHMNEGHSAFLLLERIREHVKDGMSFDEAAENVKKASIFTTHTPVPAGIDQFPVWLVERFFNHYWDELGIDREKFLSMASQPGHFGDNFSMAVLALKYSGLANAVSELHGKVSRRMFQFLWPDRQEQDVPITHITNGIHTGSWLGRQMGMLFRKYMGENWMDNVDDPAQWSKIFDIPDKEIWDLKLHYKRKLATFLKERVRNQWSKGEVHPVQVIAGGVLFDPYALTIGFARRFATYKRAYLLFHDYQRLKKLVTNSDMPVQFVFAGKAHPADEPGKMIIQQVYRAVKDAEMAGRLVFIEDYDMDVARYMVQGVDVWMNTPRRPNEASGTSGMKVALNGGLNFSILDGWWREGFNGRNGWAISDDADYEDHNIQDEADAESMYDALENDIIPMYYDRFSRERIPEEWLQRVKESIRTLAPQFSMKRMVKEYMSELYLKVLNQ